jgi:hypothetical protein
MGCGLIVFLEKLCKTNGEKKRATRRGEQVALRRELGQGSWPDIEVRSWLTTTVLLIRSVC